MGGLIALAVSVGLADSINPSTVGPALYLATRSDAPRRLHAFIAGVFLANLLGGVLLTLGPGQALLALVPRPNAETRGWLELSAGGALAILAAVLWLTRAKLAQRFAGKRANMQRRSFLLGASIMAVELPTALPYFAVIAAVVGSGRNVVDQLVALAIFNAAFVTPLLLIAAIRRLMQERGSSVLERSRALLDRFAPILVPILILAIALVLIALGSIGVARA
jgi:cytochrome c biogenesis protein CcdA